MQNPAATRLLAELDPLDYPTRMRLLAERTLGLAEQGAVDPVLDEFAAGDAHLRRLALTMAKIARRTDRVIAALDDPLYRIRAEALFACARTLGTATESAMLASLDDAPSAWRRDLVRAVSAAKRTDLADLLAEAHRDRLGEKETARLLPSCSPAVAERLLPGLVHLVPNWTRLGAAHPEPVLEFVRGELAQRSAGPRDGVWTAYGAGVLAVAERHPLRVLDLLEQFPSRLGVPFAVLQRIHILIRADEVRTLRLLAAADGRVETRWRQLSHGSRKRLAATGWPELEAVGRALWDRPADFARMLRDLPPSARSAFFDAVTADRESDRAILAPAVLDAVPHARRHAEARRMLALGSVCARADRRLEFVARLPWAEALPELRTAVRRADPDERAAAYPLLVGCAVATGRPAEVTALLTTELLDRLRNEQDPVRRAALTALATVPAERFEDTEEVADALARLVADALAARDASWPTTEALLKTACRILAHHAAAVGGATDATTDDVLPAAADDDADGETGPAGGLLAWALTALEQLAGAGVAFPFGRLDRSLRRGQEFAVHRALEPWIMRGIERADHRLALALAQALGRRAWDIPALQQNVAHAIRHGTTATCRQAIELWLADFRHRDERVGVLVAWDPTVAMFGRVAGNLSLRSTDLLDGYLDGDKPLEGRFIPRGAVWVPTFRPSAYRWQPRQLTAYARLTARIAEDAGARMQARVAAVHTLGALSAEGERLLRRHLDATDISLVEAALGELAWSEDPAAALPTLLGYAGGDRARVAVYAANRAARFARPSAAAPALREVALSTGAKVTSRKEVLRIAAELEIPGLVDLIGEVWRVPGQHRDVKAAAASRLGTLMDDPRVLPLLREAAADDPAISAPLLRTNPRDLPERHRAGYGELIAEVSGTQDPKASGTALAAAPAWYRWTDTVATAVCAAVADPGRRGDRAAPPSALFALLDEGMPIERYVAVLDTLLVADARDEQDETRDESPRDPDAEPDEQDRPARRRLISIAGAAASYGRGDLAARRRVLLVTADALAGRAGFACLAAELAADAADLEAAPAAVAAELLALAARVPGRRDAAARAGSRLAGQVRADEPWSPGAVLAGAELLARRPDPETGLIALGLVAAVGRELGWPASCRQVIRTLRRHPDPAVAEAALDVDTGAA